MTDTKIKICGLSRNEDVDFANMLNPEFIGFVFVPRSKRYVNPDAAARLRLKLRDSISAVGVFADEKIENIEKTARDGVIDMIQLHGSESSEYIMCLRQVTGKPVIKAFSISKIEDVKKAVMSPADFILLDNGAGGTGRTFDWTLTGNIERKFFLSGGLNADNVETAIMMTHPYAVDVSSGVEKNGVKDSDRIRTFIKAVRGD